LAEALLERGTLTLIESLACCLAEICRVVARGLAFIGRVLTGVAGAENRLPILVAPAETWLLPDSKVSSLRAGGL